MDAPQQPLPPVPLWEDSPAVKAREAFFKQPKLTHAEALAQAARNKAARTQGSQQSEKEV